MLKCIFWTALATWFVLGMYSVFTTYGFSFNYIGAIFTSAFGYASEYLGFILGFVFDLVVLILIGFVVYLIMRYSKRITDEKIEEKKQQQLKQLQELEDEYNKLAEQKKQEIQQLEAKLKQYKDTLNEISNLQDKIGTLFGRLINESYNFVISKEKLIEALRQRRAKQLETAIKQGTMTEKSAERARKKFNKLLEKAESSINQEKKLFNLLVGEKLETIEQLLNQIRGGENV